MSNEWIWISCLATACLAPLSCSDDETQPTGPSSSRASAASSGGASSSSASNASSTGTSGGQGGVGGTPSCEECMGPLLGNGGICGPQQIACTDDAECNAWLACYANCMRTDFTAACFDGCDTQQMSAASLYGPLVTCVCGECAGPCAPFCM